MEPREKIHIVGIGEDGVTGLTGAARELVKTAELLVGEAHTLELVEESGGKRLTVGRDFGEVVEQIDAAGDQRVVILAEGDPLFYGVARYLCDKLGKDRFEVVPHVSTMQLAFARVKESWEESFLTNLADRSLETVLEVIRGAEKVGLFTSKESSPPRVSRFLLDHGIDYFTGYVCENLGSPDERVTHGELRELAEQTFAPMNVMILVRKPSMPDRPSETVGRRLFGNPDETFLQSRPKRGLLTPTEIRSMALAELDLGPKSIVWDVGAGSGSLSVEAAQIAAEGTIYAIEMDQEDYQLIVENAKRFDVDNLKPILGRAPEAWFGLPEPDAVFVGGSGQEVGRLVDASFQRLKSGGRLVVTMRSIENVAGIHDLLRRQDTNVHVWMINLARGNYQLGRIRFESMNPTFLMTAVKP